MNEPAVLLVQNRYRRSATSRRTAPGWLSFDRGMTTVEERQTTPYRRDKSSVGRRR